jgi:hypothetical protein
MTEESKEFQRVSFFRGFFASEEDFNHLVNYDLEKHKLHNHLSHSPGVVLNHSGELKLTARQKGDFSIEVAPGYAIDGEGNDIFLWETKVLTIDISKYQLPLVVYIVLKYFDEPMDFITNKANPQYKGHRRVAERVKLEISPTPPDISEGIELGRVRLEDELKDVKNPEKPDKPQTGELDTRFIPIAGTFGWFLTPEVKANLFTVFDRMKLVFIYLFKEHELKYSMDAYQAAMTAEMVSVAGKIDFRNAFQLLKIIYPLEDEISNELENTPKLSQRKEVGEYKNNLMAVKNITESIDITPEDLNNLIIYQSKATGSLEKLLSTRVAKFRGEEVPEDWDGLTLTSDELKIYDDELPLEVMVDNVRYKLVDTIEIMNDNSEKDHEFKFGGVQRELKQNVKASFPSGKSLVLRGRRLWGGFSQFKIKNLEPERDVLLIRRIDFQYGNIKTDVEVEGTKVGTSEITGNDRKFRWRNWPFIINGKFITKVDADVKLIALSAEREETLYGFFFYQAML